MRRLLILAIDNKSFETQEAIVRWILTIYGRNIFHIHRNGCSIHLDRLDESVVKKIYDYVAGLPAN